MVANLNSPDALERRAQLTISRILRVNHAGEYGAIRIYAAQVALLLRSESLDSFLRETLLHEQDHLRQFRALMPSRGTRPCGALPLWGLGGTVLGALTAIIGRNTVLVCTEAVERTVHRHLADQLAWLADHDSELSATIKDIQEQEFGHLSYARRERLGETCWTRLANRLIVGVTETLIWFSTYGASGRMTDDLRRPLQ